MKQDLGLMYGEQNLDLMYSMMIIVNNIVSYTSKLFSSNLYVCVCVCVCIHTHIQLSLNQHFYTLSWLNVIMIYVNYTSVKLKIILNQKTLKV